MQRSGTIICNPDCGNGARRGALRCEKLVGIVKSPAVRGFLPLVFVSFGFFLTSARN